MGKDGRQGMNAVAWHGKGAGGEQAARGLWTDDMMDPSPTVAFYAPMKPPDHPVPSGDRQIARGFIAALARAGFHVDLACRFRAWEGRGDASRQQRLERAGHWLADRLAERLATRPEATRPRLWFTYHLYHKAPDWLGPAVSDRLGIPYVVAEASRALKQADGPWARGFTAADTALARADRVFAMTARGARGLAPVVGEPGDGRLTRLAPFLANPAMTDPPPPDRAAARAALADGLGLDPDSPWLITVAMMRPGDKLASYRLLGEALWRLAGRRWTLIVAGDGPARAEVTAAFAGLPVAWVGTLRPAALRGLYGAGDVFVWPGLREGYGMVYLEAQAQGLPVVACDSGGVADVVSDEGGGGRLVPEGDAATFADAVAALLDDPAARAALAEGGRRRMRDHHGLDAAAATLGTALRGLVP